MAASASPMASQLRSSFSSTSTARRLVVPKGISTSPFGVSPAKITSSFTVRSVKIEKKWNNASHSLNLVAKTHLSFTLFDLIISNSPVLASESTESSSGKIDLEAILISIDDFINRYPFFVAGCTFIYLVVIPLVQFYLSKRKPISAINAYRKLKNQPESQLLDIREEKTLALLASPNLKLMGKTSVRIPFNQEEELGFLEKIKNSFSNPEDTVVCILDNFDGNSSKVAELLVNECGFKEAYYIKGGVRGEDGWLEIQDDLLPPSVHMYSKKKVKALSESDLSVVEQKSDEIESAGKAKN